MTGQGEEGPQRRMTGLVVWAAMARGMVPVAAAIGLFRMRRREMLGTGACRGSDRGRCRGRNKYRTGGTRTRTYYGTALDDANLSASQNVSVLCFSGTRLGTFEQGGIGSDEYMDMKNSYL